MRRPSRSRWSLALLALGVALELVVSLAVLATPLLGVWAASSLAA